MVADNLDDEPLTPEEAGQEKKKKIKKAIIIIAPLLIVLLGASYYFLVVLKSSASDIHAIEKKNGTQRELAIEQNTYLDIDQITVPLSPSGTKREYLRLDLTLRVGSEEESAAIARKLPIIRDSLLVFLKSLRSSDFNSSHGTLYLKEEITKRINKITSPIVIKEVLFQEITLS
jgi:flagellar basal body-associated protein FliL